MLWGGVRVHQIVATAFHGSPEDQNMVIDHIDTNRCNNRPENLRWVTRLENVLNNPVTRKRITLLLQAHGHTLKDFIENNLNKAMNDIKELREKRERAENQKNGGKK